MDSNDAIDALSALAHAARLAIFRALVRAGPAGLSAGAVADAVGGRQNTTSTNLAILSRAGLISGEREGRVVRYRADLAAMHGLVLYLVADCCDGQPELCDPIVETLSALDPAPEAQCCD